MNCPRCHCHVFIGQYMCDCGYLLARPETVTLHEQLRKMGLEKQQGESEKAHADRCKEYLKKNFNRAIPPAVKHQMNMEAQEEAIRERLAIQEEGNDC